MTEPTQPSEPGEPTAAVVHTPPPAPSEPAPTRGDASAAARLLEIAARNADQLVTEAQAEAEAMKGEARAEADQILGDARTEAERVRAGMEAARIQAEDDITRLRQTQAEQRDRMRQHLNEMLAQLDANPIA